MYPLFCALFREDMTLHHSDFADTIYVPESTVAPKPKAADGRLFKFRFVSERKKVGDGSGICYKTCAQAFNTLSKGPCMFRLLMSFSAPSILIIIVSTPPRRSCCPSFVPPLFIPPPFSPSVPPRSPPRFPPQSLMSLAKLLTPLFLGGHIEGGGLSGNYYMVSSNISIKPESILTKECPRLARVKLTVAVQFGDTKSYQMNNKAVGEGKLEWLEPSVVSQRSLLWKQVASF